ncbi:MAG TPA: Crp/Fnr family transcriptional regulator [Pyrinomonadaceae bacterium]|jgi:CRP-like cAMP-binding protein
MIRINEELLEFMNGAALSLQGRFVAERRFAPRAVVLEQGVRVEFVHIVKSGIAKCYLMEENGAEFIQEFFGAGEIFGEIEMFHDEESFGAVEALTDLVVYRLSRSDFERLLTENQKFNRLILKGLAAKVKYKAFRHSFHQLNPIETNLLRLKGQFPDFLKVISKPDVANYLGVTERSLNRSLKSLKERKLIE